MGNVQTHTVESVPNAKLINNCYVSNPDNLLSDATVGRINLLVDSLERETTARVSVVMLKSIGDADVFDFAQSFTYCNKKTIEEETIPMISASSNTDSSSGSSGGSCDGGDSGGGGASSS